MAGEKSENKKVSTSEGETISQKNTNGWYSVHILFPKFNPSPHPCRKVRLF